MKFIKNVFLAFTLVVVAFLGSSSMAQAADAGIQYSVFWSAPTNYRMLVVSPPSSACATATIRGGNGKGSDLWWDNIDYYTVPCDGAQRVVDVYVSMKSCYRLFGLYVSGVQYGRVGWVYNPTAYSPGC